MTESGHGLQILNVTESHNYELDEEELEQLLLREDVKNLPVVVVSVTGAYRGGKSFLLNFFLRYLSSPDSARQDGSWLGEDSEPLHGFKWRSGVRATTMGILMWSEPFITTLPSGDKVAILLVDTQGNFDSRSTVRDNSTIFALSTLVSSVQIYNLSYNIKEDDLQHLELFTEYGKVINSGDSNAKAFQVLEFLVRDWQFPEEYPYGEVGGKRLLEEKLQISDDLAKDMQDLRRRIRSSFEKVSCFLMPHPGFKVLKNTFTGEIKDIDPDFRAQLIDLVKYIFSPEKLLPKTINGEQVKAGDLFNYFITYMELFNSDLIPTPTNIFAATVKAGLLSAVSEARDIYEKGMDSECGTKQLNVPVVDLEFLHKKYVAIAIAAYTHKKKMGTEEEAVEYLDKLKKELNDRLPQFLLSNESKIQTAINNAQDAYEEYIKNISQDELFCVHPMDLENVHKAGVDAATKIYDAARKRITQKNDDERAIFVKGFKKQYELLRRNNDRNNNIAVNEVWMMYWKVMQKKAALEPPLTDDELEDEHTTAQENACKQFDLKRNTPSHYPEDVYKFNLTKEIQESYVFLKTLHKSKNKEAMQEAIAEYDNYINEHWNNMTECLHPDDLEELHRVAICRALTAFRPKRQCSAGFDYNNEDETTLYEVINQRHQSSIKSNERSNESAVSLAYIEYVTSMQAHCGFSPMWLLIVPYIMRNMNMSKYQEESKSKALNVFYTKRHDIGYHSLASSDPFRERLDRMIEAYYVEHFKSQDWSTLQPFLKTLQNLKGGENVPGDTSILGPLLNSVQNENGNESERSNILKPLLNSLQEGNGENHSSETSWLQNILNSLNKQG